MERGLELLDLLDGLSAGEGGLDGDEVGLLPLLGLRSLRLGTGRGGAASGITGSAPNGSTMLR